jgi:outer membrane protein OmpU
MNKLTKIGLTSLCGSLAAVASANAGDMTVTGGVDMSWVSQDSAAVGNPIGIGSNLTFKGSGELDNGWTFDLTVAMLNNDVYSNTNVTVDMQSLGKLDFNQGNSGNGIDAFDDKMPTAWEETWGTNVGTGVQLVSGIGTQQNVMYTTPTMGGITLTVAAAPDMGAADTGDKAFANTDDGTGAGYDATININPSLGTEILSGLNLFVGGHTSENFSTNEAEQNDRYEATGGVTMDIGPISLGYQRSGIATGDTLTKTDVDWYKNEMYGVSFNVNDDLSASYGKHTSEQGFVNPGAKGGVDMEITSFQIAYTVGGASLRYARTDVTNAAYQLAESYDKSGNVISVSLAF